jgi:ABC-2 type transport system ATP-binding protein
MKQRLGLAMALFARPSVVVLDEPMNGLDPAGIAELRAFLRALPERFGSSVLLSSHLLAELEQTCHRVLFVRDGRLVAGSALTEAPTRLPSLRLRTTDDRRAFELLQREPFVVEVTADPDGLICRIAEADVAAVAPVLVRDGVGLLELARETRQLERAYLAHYSSQDTLLR